MRTWLLAGVALFAAPPAFAQDQMQDKMPNGILYDALGKPDNWTIGGMFRLRLEGIDDQFRANGAKKDQLLSIRSAIFAEYDTGRVRIGAELWDARGYLEEPGSTISTGEVNALELVQGYVAYDFDKTKQGETWLKIGRMTIAEGSRRLVSRQGYRNTTNAYTGARFHHHDASGGAVDLFYVLPQVRLPSDADGIRNARIVFDKESTDLQFFGGSYVRPVGLGGATLEAYGYGLIERDSPGVPSLDRHLFTPGVRLLRKPATGKSDFEIEGIAQTGHARATLAATDSRDLPVRAYYLHAEAGHTFSSSWSPRLAVQFDLGSGNRNPNRINRFDSLYGGRRFDLGPTALFGPISRANLVSPAARLEVKPDARNDGFVAVRPVWLQSSTDSFGASGVRDRSGHAGRYVGTQVELRAHHVIVPKVLQVGAGLSWLFKGRFYDVAPNAPTTGDTTYGYVGTLFTF